MTLLSAALGGAVLIYTAVYAICSTLPILRYNKSLMAGNIRTVSGVVAAKINEENKAIRGKLINVSYPVYSFMIGEEKQSYQSPVKYCNVSVGDKALISYDERTKEAWVRDGIPLMIKQIVVRVLVITAILAVLVLEEIIL
ncbi:hypothetical protein OBV_p-00230 (plasmid) [Oscillibacter valericigenes Sjm18-20]|nr:hypothetical protein OBV_p-00230 [Oscillibacter valericigenes Sjm18-20]